MMYLLPIYTYSENFISLILNGLKVWIFAALFEEDRFIFLLPNFVKFYFFFMFAYPENVISLFTCALLGTSS